MLDENQLQTLISSRVAARYKDKLTTEKGNTVYLYSERQISKRNKEKAERLDKLMDNIGSVRAQVKKDLKSKDLDTRLIALAVGLMDHTAERVGNEESADDGHFGVTGWKKDHITFGSGSATVKYVGKSGVKQDKKVTDSQLVKALKEARDECEGSIFEHKDTKITAQKVNDYLAKFDITAKDLRGLHANQVMRAELAKVRKGKLPSDAKERKKLLKEEFKKALEVTAESVGHEPATLRNQYLTPGLEDEYLQGRIMDRMTKEAGVVLESYVKKYSMQVKKILAKPVSDIYDIQEGIYYLKEAYRSYVDGLDITGAAFADIQKQLADIMGVLNAIQDGRYSDLTALKDLISGAEDTSIEGSILTSLVVEISSLVFGKKPSLAKILGYRYLVDTSLVKAAAAKAASKASPSEVRAFKDYAEGTGSYHASLKIVSEFLDKNVYPLAKKLLKRAAAATSVDWGTWVLDVYRYLNGAHTEGQNPEEWLQRFSIGDVKVVLIGEEGDVKPYASALIEAKKALESKGFKNLWYGTIFLSREFRKLTDSQKKDYADLGYSLESTAGTYHSSADVITLTLPPGKQMVQVIVHEMGHRYYYKGMRMEQRVLFNSLVQIKKSEKTRDMPSGLSDEDGVLKPVTPVSDYGGSSIEEAFAEAFTHYVLGFDMNRDQLESFKQVLKTARLYGPDSGGESSTVSSGSDI